MVKKAKAPLWCLTDGPEEARKFLDSKSIDYKDQSVVLFNKNIKSPYNVVTIDKSNQMKLLLQGFKRCVCRVNPEDGVMESLFLSNKSSCNQIVNGVHYRIDLSRLSMDTDFMVYFPEFWYKGVELGDGYYAYLLTIREKEGYHHIAPSLVGVFKGTVKDDKLYSRSNKYRSVNISMNELSQYARNRGEGYHLIDYQQHSIIAWMFYMKYSMRDATAKCGNGYNDTKFVLNGSTVGLGMKDTYLCKGRFDEKLLTNFLGIEGCWGYIGEYIEGAHVYGDDKFYVYDKGDFHDLPFNYIMSSTKRSFPLPIMPEGFKYGWIDSLVDGEFMDVLPASIGDPTLDGKGVRGRLGSSDYYTQFPRAKSLVLVRSGNSGRFTNGVSCLTWADPNVGNEYNGSRLAYDGVIRILDESKFTDIMKGSYSILDY